MKIMFAFYHSYFHFVHITYPSTTATKKVKTLNQIKYNGLIPSRINSFKLSQFQQFFNNKHKTKKYYNN